MNDIFLRSKIKSNNSNFRGTYQQALNTIKHAPIGSEEFRRRQDQAYYKLEKDVIKPLIWDSDTFNHYADILLCQFQKEPLKGLQIILADFIHAFGLNMVSFRITKRKNFSSYYSAIKNCVFINEADIKRLKKSPTICNAKELLYIAIHELAHAYTNRKVYEYSYHESFYLMTVIDLFQFIGQFDKKELELKIQEELIGQRFLFIEHEHYKRKTFDSFQVAVDYLRSLFKQFPDFFESDEPLFRFESDMPIHEFHYEKGIYDIISGYIYKINDEFHVVFVDLILYDKLLKEQEQLFLGGLK